MILPGIIHSSIWAYGSHDYPKYLGITTSLPNQPQMGCWSSPTLAPNGKVYCLPVATIMADTSTLQKIAVITPGSPNTSTTNYTASTISFIDADGSPGRPLIPSSGGTNSTWRRYGQKGILAPNGLLYFLPESESSLFILDPTSETWDLKTFTDIETETGLTSGSIPAFSFKSAVLGQDGYIYLIPNRAVTIRIAPRNTAVNPGSTDVYEKGYYDNTTDLKKFRKISGAITAQSMYHYPKSSSGVQLTTTQNAQTTTTYVGDIAMGIQHPNGKIYMGGGFTRWIFILDPANWGQSNEIYSTADLNMSSYLLDGGGSAKAFSKDLTLLKKQTGQSTTSLKMQYITDTYVLASGTQAYTQLLQSLEIDPTTNTVTPITSCFPLNTSGNSGNNLGNTGGILSTRIQFPTGLILKNVESAGSYARYVLGGDSQGVSSNYQNYVRNSTSSILAGLAQVGNISTNPLFAYSIGGYSRIGGSVIPPNEKSAITIIVGAEGATVNNRSGEIVSIKEYSPETTYFSYTEDDKDLYQIPSDLTTLPTSLYNSYCNTTK